ncbi:MAG: hypothetical protein JXP34_00775 [Planctomycetes bacterium]|nr:hypothetical protein [Planctomycetota bacterium]
MSLDVDGDGVLTIADYFALRHSGVADNAEDASRLRSILLSPERECGVDANVDPGLVAPVAWTRPNGGSDLEFVHFGLLSRKQVSPGEKGVVVPVWLGSRDGAEGFRISLRFDRTVIENVRLQIQPDVASRAAEVGVYEGYADQGFIGAAVFGNLVDTGFYDLLSLRHTQIARIVFDVRADAGAQPAVRIGFQAMPERVFGNELSVDGCLRLPREEAPFVIPIELGAGWFVRGDANRDGAVDIGDAIEAIAHLFLGGALPCPDAADINDDGRLLLGDPIGILQHIFGRAACPPPPFPCPGEDPTPDALEPCGLGS